MDTPRDHGGGLDAARAIWGGAAADWIDLSTGINPEPYPLPDLPARAWTALPDAEAQTALTDAARAFWRVPDGAAILATPGASAPIAHMPALAGGPGIADIPAPTYNEHEAAFRAAGWTISPALGTGRARVLVHPNNPDGRRWSAIDADAPFTVIDESFCDVVPGASLMPLAIRPGTVILKSFGKFWGLAGLRLGFIIGHPDTLAPMARALGPWPVSGPALAIGTAALRDDVWADNTRARLSRDAARLDALLAPHGSAAGGTDLFRLIETADATAFQARLARHRIWSRIFPWSPSLIRLGLPPGSGWSLLEAALG